MFILVVYINIYGHQFKDIYYIYMYIYIDISEKMFITFLVIHSSGRVGGVGEDTETKSVDARCLYFPFSAFYANCQRRCSHNIFILQRNAAPSSELLLLLLPLLLLLLCCCCCCAAVAAAAVLGSSFVDPCFIFRANGSLQSRRIVVVGVHCIYRKYYLSA